MQLDRIDYGIIEALQNDGRLSNKELASRVGLAPSSCLERVRKLEAGGVIEGYHARVSPEAMGIHLEAVVYVRLASHTPAESRQFEERLAGFPEVVSMFNVAGRWDYLVHVAVPSVLQLQAFTQEALTSWPAVSRVETSLVFEHRRTVKLQSWQVPKLRE